MNCKGCGKVIPGINLEFGGAVRLSVDGDDYACNSGCVERARAAQNRDMTVIADPATNISAYLGAPRELYPLGKATYK